MSVFTIILILLVMGAVGAVAGFRRARRFSYSTDRQLHSRPAYHASYVFSAAFIPAFIVMGVWLVASPLIVSADIRSSFTDEQLSENGLTSDLAYGIVSSIGDGLVMLPDAERAELEASSDIETVTSSLRAAGRPIASAAQAWMIPLAVERNEWLSISRIAMTVVVIGLSLAGAAWSVQRLHPRLRARNQVELVVRSILILCSSIAIMTTVGIVFSMLFETIDFFSRVSFANFFLNLTWEPRFAAAGSTAEGQFGIIPLLAGTFYIAGVALLVAVPIGLFAAIYLSEYATRAVRGTVKPLLEVLAGIPTIVYGFFALITVGPFLRDLSAQIAQLLTGNFTVIIQAQSILTAGLVMGIMLIPFVSSLSDDIITAVPRSLRDGSLGLGATRSETMKRVILPAAIPGIVSAILLTASRAIGETMIVVLAAGVAANLTANPFEAMTTVTVKIVNQLTGDLQFDSPQTLVAFALGMTLFVITLGLNIYALHIVRKYKEQYE